MQVLPNTALTDAVPIITDSSIGDTFLSLLCCLSCSHVHEMSQVYAKAKVCSHYDLRKLMIVRGDILLGECPHVISEVVGSA